MNARKLREYWCDLYKKKHGEDYRIQKKTIVAEITLLKRLIDAYDEDVVEYAMERFINKNPKHSTVILNFTSKKYFENRFDNLLKLKKILPYYKLLNIDSDRREEIKELINEYELYAVEAEVVYDAEKVRKQEIIKILEEIREDVCKKS